MSRTFNASRTITVTRPPLPVGKRVQYARSVVVIIGMFVIGIGSYHYGISHGTTTGGSIIMGVFFGLLGIFPAAFVSVVLYPFFWLFFYLTTNNTMQIRTEITAEEQFPEEPPPAARSSAKFIVLRRTDWD
jgi:hypothetical protein